MQKTSVLSGRLDWPALMYTAVGMRGTLPLPSISPPEQIPSSHAHLSIGYYNVMLPTNDFPFSASTSNNSAVNAQRSNWFWNQARDARRQGKIATRHPNFIARSVEHGKDRCLRAKAFAKQDDERLGIASSKPPLMLPSPSGSAPLGKPTRSAQAVSPPKRAQAPISPPSPPSVALVGLSLIGDLDRIYKSHQTFPSLQLTHSTSGTRKGPGALLIFSHSLAGRLYIHVGWDQEGFEPGLVEDFAKGISTCVKEFALQEMDVADISSMDHFLRSEQESVVAMSDNIRSARL